MRLLPLLSQEFLAHSRLFVRPSFDLLTGRTILFYFFSPLLGEDGLIFEGTIEERVTFLFSTLLSIISSSFRSVEDKRIEIGIWYYDKSNGSKFLDFCALLLCHACWVVQIDFLFFVLLVLYARGTNIYIHGLFFFFVDRRGRIERKGCFGMGEREGLTGWNWLWEIIDAPFRWFRMMNMEVVQGWRVRWRVVGMLDVERKKGERERERKARSFFIRIILIERIFRVSSRKSF